MLDTETKRRIDTARDILVGKVPDPKSQVEQITIALIYKFMDDMDADAEEMGGKRKFFAKEYARYGWSKLMQPGLGGHEMLNLYAEGIQKMPENPGIPPLFREIFKNAYLPYRDPETLKAFLKVIDEFQYDHSERLGDAFEYLLLVLGSQGDAGQFRTPRHIIDFIVDIVDPKKTDTVLDPACGTAGFLISSYKHILKANTDAKGHNKLTPSQRERLVANFKGYDISPDMVRLSLVNLYLHGFPDPHIVEYDTLTSLDRWNEHADVILANPPFMSPKGGIKPHNRFGVQSKRSEVLFVDYIAEHLTPNGRAGVIVPEGIIFQSQNAYRQLRKLLVEDYLVAVVSLPAGVFNPYSGVKTSILILDKSLAKRAQTIAFFKIENDGFNLGAQRRPIDKDDLPQVRAELMAYLEALRSGGSGPSIQSIIGQIVPKEKIAANGDYNLSGERYRKTSRGENAFPLVRLAEICDSILTGPFGSSLHQSDYVIDGIPVINPQNIIDGRIIKDPEKGVSRATAERLKDFALRDGDIVIARRGEMGRCGMATAEMSGWLCGTGCFVIRLKPTSDAGFIFLQIGSPAVRARLTEQAVGVTLLNLNQGILADLEIPLPPLDVQKKIVAEIEGYQKVIDGARAVLENYRPHIPVDPAWPIVALGDIAEVKLGKMLDKEKHTSGRLLPYLNNVSLRWNEIDTSNLPEMFFEDDELDRFGLRAGDVVVCEGGEPGRAAVWDGKLPDLKYQKAVHRVRFNVPFEPRMLVLYLQELTKTAAFESLFSGSTIKHLTRETFTRLPIPCPPISSQRAIVAEIEADQALVNANHELIARMEKKIQATLARVWGEDQTPPATNEQEAA